jgi:peptide/nickel transport system substrate-binding protein
MNCPNDRYVNDARICQTVAANLARIGVKINLAAETKGTYFPKILRRDTSFYLLGWTPGTYDAHNALNALMACVDDKGAGQFNLGLLQPQGGRTDQKDPVGNRQGQARRDDQGSL